MPVTRKAEDQYSIKLGSTGIEFELKEDGKVKSKAKDDDEFELDDNTELEEEEEVEEEEEESDDEELEEDEEEEDEHFVAAKSKKTSSDRVTLKQVNDIVAASMAPVSAAIEKLTLALTPKAAQEPDEDDEEVNQLDNAGLLRTIEKRVTKLLSNTLDQRLKPLNESAETAKLRAEMDACYAEFGDDFKNNLRAVAGLMLSQTGLSARDAYARLKLQQGLAPKGKKKTPKQVSSETKKRRVDSDDESANPQLRRTPKKHTNFRDSIKDTLGMLARGEDVDYD